jgi:diguanylate cyclase (GGDEF)-like protein
MGGEWFVRCLADPAAGLAAFGDAMAGGSGSTHHETELRGRSGAVHLLSWHVLPLHDDDGRVLGVAALGQDITEQRRAEEVLRMLSERDELTGLLNRRGFQNVAAAELARPMHGEQVEALIAIDLDGFKPINDTFGHAEGDRALTAVAALLHEVVRGSDHTGRLGGDEFAIYLTRLSHPDDVAHVEAHLARALAAHNAEAARAGRPYALGWSIGATLRAPGDDLATMLARADVALYAAKATRSGPLERAALAA